MSTSVFNLSSLDGSNGLRLDGATQADASGVSVSGAGDVNGDGFGDVIVGAINAGPNVDSSGRARAGYPVPSDPGRIRHQSGRVLAASRA